MLPSVSTATSWGELGRSDEAAAEFDRAATMTDNQREREVLADKAARARSLAEA
jgi:predicted RNA polymerase sigma factor